MEKKETVINRLIEQNGYARYLEIGLGDGKHFEAIKAAEKVSVDPGQPSATFHGTSDEFFAQNEQVFDIIFIDGLHHADQVRKDITNALKVLSDDGVILVHDIRPTEEEQTIVPRAQKVWTGDVYKAWYGFRSKYPDIQTEEFDVEWGLGLIRPKGRKVRANFEDMELTWEDYKVLTNG